jgi:hypothetical protein
MKLAYSPEHEALRQELRDYYKKLLTRRSSKKSPLRRMGDEPA